MDKHLILSKGYTLHLSFIRNTYDNESLIKNHTTFETLEEAMFHKEAVLVHNKYLNGGGVIVHADFMKQHNKAELDRDIEQLSDDFMCIIKSLVKDSGDIFYECDYEFKESVITYSDEDIYCNVINTKQSMSNKTKQILSDYNVLKQQFNLAKVNYANKMKAALIDEIVMLLKQSNRIKYIGIVVSKHGNIEVDYINGFNNGDDSEELDWYIPKYYLETDYYDSSIHDIDNSSIITKCNELISEIDTELMVIMFGDNCKVTINKQGEVFIESKYYTIL